MDKKPENIGDLGEFFNIIGKAKKQKEDEFRSVVGDINLDGIFDNLKEENKKIKKKKKKEKKQIEQLEKFLFEDVDKKEEPKKEEIPEDQEIPDENTKVGLTEKVEEVEEEIVAEVESEEIQENDHVDEAIKVLDKIVSNKEEISEETDYELIKKEIKELRTLIHRNVNGTSGGGEVRLEFLDDVDRDTAKVDGKFLKYDSSSGKFVGASGGGGSQSLNDTLGIGNTSDIGMSVGVVTATSFVGNGVDLTGIVTSIVAGSNVTISGSTGRVTINASSGGGGTGGKFNDDQTNSGIHTTSSNVGLGTTNPRYQLEVGSVGAGGTQLWVNGDARITGILSVGTATITLDPTTNKVQIGTGITIDATTNTIEVAGSKIADNSGNAEFTGIVTATTVQVGSATTIHSSGIDLGNGNITSHNINSTGIVTSTQLNVTGHTETDTLRVSGVSTFQNNVKLTTDNRKLIFGNGEDLEIFHDGSNNYIVSNNGSFNIKSPAFKYLNTSPSTGRVRLFHSNSARFETTASGIDVTGHTETDTLRVSGITTFQDNVNLGDNTQIVLGDGPDLKIYHDGSNSYVEDTGVGALIMKGTTLRFRSTTNEKIINAHQNGSVDLFYDNSKKLSTTNIGIAVSNGTSDTATITGPANLIIDPAVVGDNTGLVRIKGDLYVDGEEFKVDSTTINLADHKVGIATTSETNLLLDGAGIGIGPDSNQKTFLYEHNSGTNPSLKSSENLNVASGKGYQINQTEVLNSTTLGSGVINSSLTSVGTLGSLTVSGDVSIADKIVHTGDTNTSISFPSTDYIRLTTLVPLDLMLLQMVTFY